MAKQLAVKVALQDKSLLIPWKFVKVHGPTYSYDQLWGDVSVGIDLPCLNYTIIDCKASESIASNETVNGDPTTNIIDILNNFGMKFFSMIVKHASPCNICTMPIPNLPAPNAFNVLMASSRHLAKAHIPVIIANPTCGIEKLQNALLTYLEKCACKFPGNCGKGANILV